MNRSTRFVDAAKNQANPWPIRVAAALAAIYVILPIDILPDVMPVIGWLDDFLVVVGVIMWFLQRRRALPQKS